MIRLALILTAITLSTVAHTSTASQAHSENWYVEQSCLGEIEVRLPDRTRVDCLTNEYAIEYDFTHKWAEAIGQALHYGLMTNRRAGIILIGSQEDAGYKRAWDVIRAYGLPIELNTLSLENFETNKYSLQLGESE